MRTFVTHNPIIGHIIGYGHCPEPPKITARFVPPGYDYAAREERDRINHRLDWMQAAHEAFYGKIK
jgi:hypothetical protein